MEEREVNLLDLMIDILLHWRGILVWMLIAGIVMGGFSYVRSSRSTSAEKSQEDTSLEDSEEAEAYREFLEKEWESEEAQREYLEEELTEPEKISVYSVLQNEKQYESILDYVNNSALMHIDPQNVQKAELVFSVKAEDPGMTLSLSNFYEALTNGLGLYEWIAEKNGISSSAASEIISVERRSGILVLDGGEPGVMGNDTLKVTIIYSDQEKCRALAKSVAEYIDEQHDILAGTIGEYETELLNQTFSTVTDTNLMSQQNGYNNTLLSLLSSSASTIENFTHYQKAFYRLLKGEALEEEEEKEDGEDSLSVVPVSPSVSLKYVIAGMFLGAFLYVFILFCRYVFNGRIRATDNLGELYGISQLGLIPGQRERKKFLGFIDEWILALRNRNKRKFSAEEAMELAAAAIKISAGKNVLDTVYLIGCDLKEGAMELCQQVKAKLEQENIRVHVLSNVLYNAEILEQLEEAKGVVLVEKAGSTLYSEIVKELELLKRQEIRVLGGIIVE